VNDYTPRGLAFVAISQAIDALKSAAAAMVDQDDDRAADSIAIAHKMTTAGLRQLDPNNAQLNT
jgi:cellobiose-specific phosphotransferase system component IIA